MNENHLKADIEAYIRVEEILDSFMDDYASYHGKYFRHPSSFEHAHIDLAKNQLTLSDYDYNVYALPLSYLWLSNWRELEDIRLKPFIDHAAAEKAKELEFKREKELEEYRRLQKQFEG